MPPTCNASTVLAPAGPLSARRNSRRSTVTLIGSMPRPYSTPGMWPSARRRRAVGDPEPVRGVAVSVVCDMTGLGNVRQSQ